MRKSLLLVVIILTGILPALGKTKKHPYDVYDHEMHMTFFEAASVACETCHADPDSFGDRSKVNPVGCHLCHNSAGPIIDANKPCTVCHDGGAPKPPSHKSGWKSKHQIYAKLNAESCTQCHTDPQFCLNCHKRRDTVLQTMHRRNFRYFHSIEARANPRKCEACHTVSYCQDCHAGRGSSKR
ncbi:MAG: hypothetical protein Q7T11_07990 [Deltaproteobacteria bacterium]|nr:hypothetical protein [Deltaproteobacteria bacterium]